MGPPRLLWPFGLRGKLATIFRAATEVNRAIFFSAAIIIVGFIPLFTLSGVEGHIFSPMAKTYAYALAGALFATFTVVPALSAYLLHERVRETETIVVSILRRIYSPMVEFAVTHRILAVAATGLLFALALFAVFASNSCRTWRKAISGFAQPCRPRSRSKRGTTSSTACGW
jgi:cobalt-zinc-cadmium resistance protein CzcA